MAVKPLHFCPDISLLQKKKKEKRQREKTNVKIYNGPALLYMYLVDCFSIQVIALIFSCLA